LHVLYVMTKFDLHICGKAHHSQLLHQCACKMGKWIIKSGCKRSAVIGQSVHSSWALEFERKENRMQYVTRGCMCQIQRLLTKGRGQKTSKSCTRNSQSTRGLWNDLFSLYTL